jgi:uncharacterized protein YndB with AHSA1/START domain
MALEVELPSDREVKVTRAFNAPAQLVWDAHTKPDLVKRWLLGPPGWSMPECEVDLRVGGAYRYKWVSDENGSFFTSSGVHKEIVPIERIVTTESMDLSGLGMEIPPGESINTLTLSEANRKTTLIIVMRFPTKEHRDGAVATGMTGGMEQSYERLEREVLAP